MTDRARRGLAAAAVAATLLAGAGCAAGSLGDDVASAVKSSLEVRGYDVDDVSCPEGLDADNDSTTCQVTVRGKEYPLEVTSKGSGNGRGNDIEFDASDIPKG